MEENTEDAIETQANLMVIIEAFKEALEFYSEQKIGKSYGFDGGIRAKRALKDHGFDKTSTSP